MEERKSLAFGDLSKRTFPRARTAQCLPPQQVRDYVPASAPLSSLRGSRTARPSQRPGFSCSAGNDDERRHTGALRTESDFVWRAFSTPSTTSWVRRGEGHRAANLAVGLPAHARRDRTMGGLSPQAAPTLVAQGDHPVTPLLTAPNPPRASTNHCAVGRRHTWQESARWPQRDGRCGVVWCGVV